MFSKCFDYVELGQRWCRVREFLHPENGGCQEMWDLFQQETTFRIRWIERYEEFKELGIYREYKWYSEDEKEIGKDDERINIIYDLQHYANLNPKFNTGFVNSIEEHLEDYGYITKGQYNKLVKIYKAFSVKDAIERDLEEVQDYMDSQFEDPEIEFQNALENELQKRIHAQSEDTTANQDLQPQSTLCDAVEEKA